MTDRELMQMALDALEEYKNVVTSGTDPNNFGGVVDGGEPARKAIQTLRDRLAQPEPVHAIDISEKRVDETAKDQHDWVGFTAAERDEIVPMLVQSLINHDDKTMTVLLRAILIDVEAKLKEKNT